MLEKELVLVEKLQYCMYMAKMLQPQRTIDQNIAKKYKDKTIKELFEDIVHERLGGRWSIGQAERALIMSS